MITLKLILNKEFEELKRDSQNKHNQRKILNVNHRNFFFKSNKEYMCKKRKNGEE